MSRRQGFIFVRPLLLVFCATFHILSLDSFRSFKALDIINCL